MILVKLKEATRLQHENLENTVDVMGKMFSPEDYKILLTKFYRFYAAIEPKVAENDLENEGFDFAERRKTPLLEKDLEALGILENARENVGLFEDLPALDTPAAAFGSVYVMEGATLGGQLITRHLKEHLGITPENGGAFFNSYGANVGQMWKSFGAAITEFAEKNQDDATIVNAARETFDSFAKCFAAPLKID